MLLANLHDDLTALPVAMVPDAGKQVVLNLGGQAEGHVEPEVGLRCKVDALRNLHLCPRVILLVIREDDDVSNLRHGHEDGPSHAEHGQVAAPRGAKKPMHTKPDQGLGDGVAERAVHDEVATHRPLGKQVDKEKLDSDLNHGTESQQGQGKHLYPCRQAVCHPDVLHVHVMLLVRVGVVADGMPVEPSHGWTCKEVAQKLIHAVDPLDLAYLEVRTLVRHPRAEQRHEDPCQPTRHRCAHNEEEPNHDTPENEEHDLGP
mmetsp:Transcript_78799/g.217908  ORF Transcript_78799/g.217908 Transcript_78799/m.217908 type:complete len:260 (+) Transcript_78799:499-1278(+)